MLAAKGAVFVRNVSHYIFTVKRGRLFRIGHLHRDVRGELIIGSEIRGCRVDERKREGERREKEKRKTLQLSENDVIKYICDLKLLNSHFIHLPVIFA